MQGQLAEDFGYGGRRWTDLLIIPIQDGYKSAGRLDIFYQLGRPSRLKGKLLLKFLTVEFFYVILVIWWCLVTAEKSGNFNIQSQSKKIHLFHR